MKKNMGIQDTVLQNIKEDNIIIGRNAVLEALKGGRSIEKILIAKGTEGSIKKIEALAREKKVQLHYEGRSILDRIVKDTNHQGVIAYTAAYEYAQTKDVFGLAEERGEDPFVIICDGIEDPHNLGAIIRSAECSGAHARGQRSNAGKPDHRDRDRRRTEIRNQRRRKDSRIRSSNRDHRIVRSNKAWRSSVSDGLLLRCSAPAKG